MRARLVGFLTARAALCSLERYQILMTYAAAMVGQYA